MNNEMKSAWEPTINATLVPIDKLQAQTLDLDINNLQPGKDDTDTPRISGAHSDSLDSFPVIFLLKVGHLLFIHSFKH